MKNTVKKGIIHLLVMTKGDGYIGICKEFGFVEEAKTQEEVIERLAKGSILLIETVRKNPSLEASLNVRPPLKYLALFYVVPVLGGLRNIFSRFHGDVRLVTPDLDAPCYA